MPGQTLSKMAAPREVEIEFIEPRPIEISDSRFYKYYPWVKYRHKVKSILAISIPIPVNNGIITYPSTSVDHEDYIELELKKPESEIDLEKITVEPQRGRDMYAGFWFKVKHPALITEYSCSLTYYDFDDMMRSAEKLEMSEKLITTHPFKSQRHCKRCKNIYQRELRARNKELKPHKYRAADHCVQCRHIYYKQYREKNKASIAAYQKQYRQTDAYKRYDKRRNLQKKIERRLKK